METQRNVNRPLFKPDTEAVLVRGLNAMTKACDALSTQNQTLNNDIEALKRKINRLQERVILNEGGKE
jgi:predicted RNase H-like nuclease (RuvC/YqgF family)